MWAACVPVNLSTAQPSGTTASPCQVLRRWQDLPTVPTTSLQSCWTRVPTPTPSTVHCAVLGTDPLLCSEGHPHGMPCRGSESHSNCSLSSSNTGTFLSVASSFYVLRKKTHIKFKKKNWNKNLNLKPVAISWHLSSTAIQGLLTSLHAISSFILRAHLRGRTIFIPILEKQLKLKS